MELQDVMEKRRSIRKYQKKEVAKELIEQIIESSNPSSYMEKFTNWPLPCDYITRDAGESEMGGSCSF